MTHGVSWRALRIMWSEWFGGREGRLLGRLRGLTLLTAKRGSCFLSNLFYLNNGFSKTKAWKLLVINCHFSLTLLVKIISCQYDTGIDQSEWTLVLMYARRSLLVAGSRRDLEIPGQRNQITRQQRGGKNTQGAQTTAIYQPVWKCFNFYNQYGYILEGTQ